MRQRRRSQLNLSFTNAATIRGNSGVTTTSLVYLVSLLSSLSLSFSLYPSHICLFLTVRSLVRFSVRVSVRLSSRNCDTATTTPQTTSHFRTHMHSRSSNLKSVAQSILCLRLMLCCSRFSLTRSLVEQQPVAL